MLTSRENFRLDTLTPMLKHPYRSEARRARDRAAAELAASDDARLRYAALEFHTAIEALAYERVLLYEEDLPEAGWQRGNPRESSRRCSRSTPMRIRHLP